LRTLYLSEKVLSDSEYNEWNDKMNVANRTIGGREEAVMKV